LRKGLEQYFGITGGASTSGLSQLSLGSTNSVNSIGGAGLQGTG
jgi:hypothetical protein